MDNTKNKKIIAPTLTIQNNILQYKESIIQMSNISQCEIALEPAILYPHWLFGGVILGIILLLMRWFIPGLILILVCSVILYNIYRKNNNLETYLLIELNSGSILLFSSYDDYFLSEAQKTIIECFNKNNKETYTINFSKCTITHSQIAGKENTMNL